MWRGCWFQSFGHVRCPRDRPPQDRPEGTDFGQSRFGHPDLTNFGQSTVGQSILGHRGFGPANLDQIQFWPIPFLAKIICFSGFTIREGPEGWGARRVGGPKFRAFFSIYQFPLFLSHCVSSRGFLVVFEALGPEMCAFGVLWLSCEAPAAPKPPVVADFGQSIFGQSIFCVMLCCGWCWCGLLLVLVLV